jgi:hypothetical protein
VNDNGRGTLQSVSQQPYAVILDASSTQSLTSLGGQAQAGTSITIEPHISEANYLQLGYAIELSNFTAAAANGLPPPSQKKRGGKLGDDPGRLHDHRGRSDDAQHRRIGELDPDHREIPVVGWFFGNRNKTARDQTLFVFIPPGDPARRPVRGPEIPVGAQQRDANIPGDFPRGEPI